MGTTRWSNDQYRDRARRALRPAADAFEHDHAVRQGEVSAGAHAKMDPLNVRLRESRDSDAHPESQAVAVLLDVTGSMQSVPRILQANLPRLMNLLIEGRYLDHPQILVGAIGDATCDDGAAAGRSVRVGRRDRGGPRPALPGGRRRRPNHGVVRAGDVLHGPAYRHRLLGEARQARLPVRDRRRDRRTRG